MKKVIFFLLAALTFVNVEAQTYEQTQSKSSNEISRLNASLNDINDKIFYLEVGLNDKMKDSVSIKKQSPSRWNELKKEKFFAKANLVNLKIKKEAMENTLKELTKLSLANTENKIKTDMKSDLPEQMSRRELKRRLRKEYFEASKGYSKNDSTCKKFKGVLANYKTGKNELATFTITRIGFPEFFPVINVVGPNDKIFIELSAGNYQVEITCGNFRILRSFEVNPLIPQKILDKDYVYWFAYKAMSDI